MPVRKSALVLWTMEPEDYLKNPVYSRDVPPCKYC